VSPHAIVWSVFAVALVVVLAMLVAQALRAARELKRFNGRLEAMGDLPIVQRLARAEDDVRRMEAAAAALGPLTARAELAIATIKRGPFPPEVVRAFRRLAAEVAAFRAFSSR
jgi:hypothetical protein